MLVTSALIYANGDVHLGHILEAIQTDIWARFQRLRGHECYYVSGDDAHGTPVMLRAERENKTPEEFIDAVKSQHQLDFHDFLISVDHYGTTHCQENRELATIIYQRLAQKGDISRRTIEQAYDSQKNMFLPDRFVKGECPRCGAGDQYGDACESCGATYSPTELKNPISVVSNTTPIRKQSEHLFFELPNYTAMLTKWMQGDALQEQVRNKLAEWFSSGLEAWDISRDAPYFGFEIPGEAHKYFYVWMDAPVGYMASFQHLCEQRSLNFTEYWDNNSTTELYHFVGKDIVYFHALFWPAMLQGSDFRLPTAIFTHGFLTVDGQKMSKSRGTFINARHYLNHLNPEYLRYYFAAKLNSQLSDIDLNLEDFKLRINSDLVGKVVNIASRCAGFIHKNNQGKLSAELIHPQLFNELVSASEEIADAYETREYSRAVKMIMELADKTNQYIDEQKPWALNKQEGQHQLVQAICTQGLNLFRLLMIYLKPILPRMAEQSEQFLNCDPLTWANLATPLLDHTINPFSPLMQRITDDQLNALISPT
ncbi:MAG: methionine--tRNA ligase [Legionellales bacterium]|nr:methionine--tRNA ligase [Legionellales bacterium]